MAPRAGKYRERTLLLQVCRRLQIESRVALPRGSACPPWPDKNMFSPTRSCDPRAAEKAILPAALLLQLYLYFRSPGDGTRDRRVAAPPLGLVVKFRSHSRPRLRPRRAPGSRWVAAMLEL